MNRDFDLNPVPAGEGCWAYQLARDMVPLWYPVTAGHGWGAGVAAPSRRYYLAVQGFGKKVILKQTVAVPPGLVGISLTIQFYMSKRLDGYASSSVAVSVNSVVLRTFALTSGFTRYSINIPTATSAMTIQFDDVSPITGYQSY